MSKKTPQRTRHDYVAEVAARTAVWRRVPLPMGTHEDRGGVTRPLSVVTPAVVGWRCLIFRKEQRPPSVQCSNHIVVPSSQWLHTELQALRAGLSIKMLSSE